MSSSGTNRTGPPDLMQVKVGNDLHIINSTRITPTGLRLLEEIVSKTCERLFQDSQKPSSASPTQLTTNTDEARAAKVTMVLTDRII
jgi:hypothetical protein